MTDHRPRALAAVTTGVHDTRLLPAVTSQPAWMADAPCAQTDPDAFHPDNGQSTNAAKAVCAGCDVRAKCLTYALDHDEQFGVWGGLSVRERRRLKRPTTARTA